MTCAQAIMQTIPRVMRAIRTEARRRQTGELSVPHLRALLHLHAHQGIGLCELAEQLGVLPSSASKIIDQLLARGLVDRQTDPGDRRRALLSLSAAGQREFAAACGDIEQFLSDRLAGLPADRLQAILAVMQDLSTIFGPDGPRHEGTE